MALFRTSFNPKFKSHPGPDHQRLGVLRRVVTLHPQTYEQIHRLSSRHGHHPRGPFPPSVVNFATSQTEWKIHSRPNWRLASSAAAAVIAKADIEWGWNYLIMIDTISIKLLYIFAYFHHHNINLRVISSLIKATSTNPKRCRWRRQQMI